MEIAENIEFDELFCKGADVYNELEEKMEQAGIDLKYLDKCCKVIQNDVIFIGFNLGYWYGKDRKKYDKLINSFSIYMKHEDMTSSE